MSDTTLSRSARDPLRQVATRLVHWDGASATPRDDELAAEEPLEVRVRAATPPATTGVPAETQSVAVIMRTPGHDEELAAGFLFTEGLVTDSAEIAALGAGTDADGLPDPNVMEIEPAPDSPLLPRLREGGYSRRFVVSSSCGVCGKNSVSAACTALPPLDPDDVRVAPSVLYGLQATLYAHQRVFAATGGLHAAGLFDATGSLLALREDIGRHNAVDKLIGRALFEGKLPLVGRILLVSGRASFEIMLKAMAAGISIVVAVSAPSSLAVELADAGGVTLAAFLRGQSINVYTHTQRVTAE